MKRITPWWLWSSLAKIIVTLILFISSMVCAAVYSAAHGTTPFPAISAISAIAALLFMAYTNWRSTVRSRRKDTLDAWHAWWAGSAAQRKQVEKVYGWEVIQIDEAGRIADKSRSCTQHGDGSTLLSDEDSGSTKRSIEGILNGLEELARGARAGVYDCETLGKLAGTTILLYHKQFHHCIEVMRDRFSNRAYWRDLSALCVEIKRMKDRERRKEERQDKQNEKARQNRSRKDFSDD